jgi:LDH2 family malate/lactate/ureidoglycolate dehydrogenase
MSSQRLNPGESIPRFRAEDLLRFGTSLLISAGLPEERARDVAEVLLEGDLLGHTTHGFGLLPLYLKSLAEGGMEKEGEPETISDHDSAITWHGRYLPGPWLVRRAIALAQERANTHPVVTIVIRQSHHIGCLQAYLKPVTDAGFLILLSCSDPANRSVTPHGGVAPRLSPDPFAVGIPTKAEPILIDISTSATANGLCLRTAASGEKLPGQWLVDREGNPSDDPRILLEGRGGSLLPLGGLDLGHKGFALALFVEAITNALSGHGRADDPKEWGASVFLQLINPNCFGGQEPFLRETTFLADSCCDTPVPQGKPPVRIPGRGALARRAAQLANGVELYPAIMPALATWAETLKVNRPSPL